MATHIRVGVVGWGSSQFCKRDRNDVGKVKITGLSQVQIMGIWLYYLMTPKTQAGMGRWNLVFSWEMTGKSCENEILGPASKTSINYEIQLDSLMRTEKKQIFFFQLTHFHYYKHIKMMSNMPYQMVYSNCQNKGWSVSNFPENLLKNWSSESGRNQPWVHLPHRYPWKSWEKKLLPKYWYMIYRGKERRSI